MLKTRFVEREIRPGVSTVIVPRDEEWELVSCVPTETPLVMRARWRVTRRSGYGPWILRLWDRLTGRVEPGTEQP